MHYKGGLQAKRLSVIRWARHVRISTVLSVKFPLLHRQPLLHSCCRFQAASYFCEGPRCMFCPCGCHVQCRPLQHMQVQGPPSRCGQPFQKWVLSLQKWLHQDFGPCIGVFPRGCTAESCPCFNPAVGPDSSRAMRTDGSL